MVDVLVVSETKSHNSLGFIGFFGGGSTVSTAKSTFLGALP